MKKILIIGPGGAGKSTLARRLGQLLNIPVIHLDAEYWRPGWIETPKAPWKEKVGELLAADSWILDGNYTGTLDFRVTACDTIIFLDLPRMVCLWRLIKRRLFYRNTTRPDMAPGCPERLTFEFVLWVWKYRGQTRPKVLKLLSQVTGTKSVLRLRTRREIESLLDEKNRTNRTDESY